MLAKSNYPQSGRLRYFGKGIYGSMLLDETFLGIIKGHEFIYMMFLRFLDEYAEDFHLSDIRFSSNNTDYRF
jgi:hypothetical protein